MTTFTLEPQENDRLQSLCGAFDENIKLIEKEFNLNISRNNFTFTVKSNDENPKSHHEQLIERSVKLIQTLYVETAPIKGKVKELDLEDVHIALQESRMLSQAGSESRSENQVYSTTIKTKRGLIKPRGENQIQYLHNILTHDISFGIGPAGTGKTFLAVAAAVEALERQEIRRILLTRPAVEAGEKLGFLPGDLGQKIEPYLRPLYDALFEMLGFEIPTYVHMPTIMKDDNGSKRKISKRKDPEAAASYYKENGIPKEAVLDYLLNILNSNYENWRKENPKASSYDFIISPEKISVSGAMFDLVKLADVSKNTIANFTAEEVYNQGLEWAEEFDKELAELMKAHKDFTIGILNIERTGTKIRKDISKWSDLRENLEYLYDEVFFEKSHDDEWQNITDKEEIKAILSEYLNMYDENDDKDTWFNKIKDLSEKHGYAREVKEYKKNPENFKGHVGDVSTVIRVALTGRKNTPDLYEILKLMGKERIAKRFARI